MYKNNSMDLKSEPVISTDKPENWNHCGDADQSQVQAVVPEVPDPRTLSRQQLIEHFNTLVWEKKLWLRERKGVNFQMSNLKDELRRVKMLVEDRDTEIVVEQKKHRETVEHYEQKISSLMSSFQLQLEQANALHNRQNEEVEKMKAFLEAEKVKCCEQQSEISNLEEQHGKISLLQQLLQNKVRDFEHQLSEKDNNIMNLRKNNDALSWDLEAAKQELLRYYSFLQEKFREELAAEENHWLMAINQIIRRIDPPQQADGETREGAGKQEVPREENVGDGEEPRVEESSRRPESGEEEEEEERKDKEEKKQTEKKEKEERRQLKKKEKQERKLKKQAEKEAKKERRRREKERKERKEEEHPAGFWSFILRRRRRRGDDAAAGCSNPSFLQSVSLTQNIL